MLENPNFHIIYLSAAIIVSVLLIVYAFRFPKTRGIWAFMAGCAVSIPWMASDMITRVSVTYEGQWAGEFIRYLCVPVLPIALYIFVQQYCGRRVDNQRLMKLLVIPTLSVIMLITNPLHHLFYDGVTADSTGKAAFTLGLYFYLVHLPYSYAVLLSALYTLAREFSRASSHYRYQLALLFIALCLPLAVNVLGLFGLIGKYTPHSFPVFFTIVAFLIFRYQFLGSNPIAYEAVFQTIRDGVLILDGRDIIRDINPAAAAGLGKKPSSVVGMHARDAFEPWPTATELYDRNPRDLGEIEVQLFGGTRYLMIESAPLAKLTGHSEGRIITIRDITDKHKQQLTLQEMAFHDPLTRLANRRKFEEEVERAIDSAAPLAILYFDLNRFKVVNDTHGHEVGDQLLQYVAARVASTLRKPDLIARLGGDEFALLIHNCDESQAGAVIERLYDNVRRPFRAGDVELVPDFAIGTAFYPEHGASLSELLRHADGKMYEAKQQGSSFIGERVDLSAGMEM
jgi:diguanylate cyclase (GGDEF)-like protein/PAS domain S-box-containing protein